MNIDYLLIFISFLAPIVRFGFTTNPKDKIIPKVFISHWLSGGVMASMVQLISSEVEWVDKHIYVTTILIGFFGKEIFIFANESILPILRKFLSKYTDK